MRRWLILSCLLVTAGAAAQQVWTWTDEQGVVHYSDRPVPGAREVQLAGAQTIPALPLPQTNRQDSGSTEPAMRYNRFAITTPAHQETLWNIEGTLDVQVDLLPVLAPEHRIDVYLDGERLNLNVAGTRFSMQEVWRGAHTMQAIVIDTDGRELARSPAVTFFVQQTSVLNPNNPNVPRLAPPQQIPRR